MKSGIRILSAAILFCCVLSRGVCGLMIGPSEDKCMHGQQNVVVVSNSEREHSGDTISRPEVQPEIVVADNPHQTALTTAWRKRSGSQQLLGVSVYDALKLFFGAENYLSTNISTDDPILIILEFLRPDISTVLVSESLCQRFSFFRAFLSGVFRIPTRVTDLDSSSSGEFWLAMRAWLQASEHWHRLESDRHQPDNDHWNKISKLKRDRWTKVAGGDKHNWTKNIGFSLDHGYIDGVVRTNLRFLGRFGVGSHSRSVWYQVLMLGGGQQQRGEYDFSKRAFKRLCHLTTRARYKSEFSLVTTDDLHPATANLMKSHPRMFEYALTNLRSSFARHQTIPQWYTLRGNSRFLSPHQQHHRYTTQQLRREIANKQLRSRLPKLLLKNPPSQKLPHHFVLGDSLIRLLLVSFQNNLLTPTLLNEAIKVYVTAYMFHFPPHKPAFEGVDLSDLDLERLDGFDLVDLQPTHFQKFKKKEECKMFTFDNGYHTFLSQEQLNSEEYSLFWNPQIFINMMDFFHAIGSSMMMPDGNYDVDQNIRKSILRAFWISKYPKPEYQNNISAGVWRHLAKLFPAPPEQNGGESFSNCIIFAGQDFDFIDWAPMYDLWFTVSRKTWSRKIYRHAKHTLSSDLLWLKEQVEAEADATAHREMVAAAEIERRSGITFA